MDAGNRAAHPQLNPFVVLDGTANSGCIGPAVGAFDIDGLVVGMERNGHVCIKGVMLGSGILENSSFVFQMHVEQICPPGPFKISFTLPGEIDARMVTSTYLSGAYFLIQVPRWLVSCVLILHHQILLAFS
ncbi:hypothetical protein QYF36_022605 [Acer negundo]|nr:hypothetical protein QYF36_022605 [Acer negundo]